MRTLLKTSFGVVAGLTAFVGSAFATSNQCGGPLFPCQVPEPGTWALVAIAAAGVAVASKFGRKK